MPQYIFIIMSLCLIQLICVIKLVWIETAPDKNSPKCICIWVNFCQEHFMKKNLIYLYVLGYNAFLIEIFNEI